MLRIRDGESERTVKQMRPARSYTCAILRRRDVTQDRYYAGSILAIAKASHFTPSRLK